MTLIVWKKKVPILRRIFNFMKTEYYNSLTKLLKRVMQTLSLKNNMNSKRDQFTYRIICSNMKMSQTYKKYKKILTS